jgi:ABC-2 type transport system permease protein
MSRLLVVAASEFLTLIRTKAFLISVLAMPVFMTGTIVVQKVTEDRVDATERRFAVIDRTGRLLPAVEAAVGEWNARAIGEDGVPRAPKFSVVRIDPDGGSPENLQVTLSDRVRAGELFAFLEIPAAVLDPSADPPARVQYHSNHPSYDTLRRFLDAVLGQAVLTLRAQAAGLDPAEVTRLTRTPELDDFGLLNRDATGQVTAARPVDRVRTMVVPGGFMALMFLIVLSSSPQLLNGVMEEKMSRISEVLISSITPFQLMMGKLLGSAAISMLLAVVYVAGAYRLAAYWGYADAVTAPMVAWFGVFLLCAVLLFGSMFISIGAAVTDFKDAQSMMTPAMLLVMLPVFTWTAVLKAPDSAMSIGLSLFPPATPFLMLLRISLQPSPPLWEILLSVALVALTTVGAVWAAGKIFRTGILLHGKSASVREMVRWVGES